MTQAPATMPDDKADKFDPKTHTWGMAYKTHDGKVGYVNNYSHSMGFEMRPLDGGRFFNIPRRNVLYRAPEYDLTCAAAQRQKTIPEWETITLQVKLDPNHSLPVGQIMFNGELYTRATPEAVLDAKVEIERLQGVLERDRTKVIEAYNALKKIIGGVSWIAESRGPYEYDDAEYQKEFGRALKAIENSIVPLFEIGRNLKDCPPTFAKAVEARMVKDEATLAKTKTPVQEVDIDALNAALKSWAEPGMTCESVSDEKELDLIYEAARLYAQGHRAAPDGLNLETIKGIRDVMFGTKLRMDKRDMPSFELQWAIREIDTIEAALSAAPVKGDE